MNTIANNLQIENNLQSN